MNPPLVTLEPRTAAHAQDLFEILRDERLYTYLDDAPPANAEALRVRFARSESRRSPDGTEHWLNWVVRDHSQRVAGYVQTTVAADGTAFIAYVMGTAFHGRGLARVAVAEMIDIVRRDVGVRTFYVRAERRNLRSVRLAQQLGFVPAPPEHVALTLSTDLGDEVLMIKTVEPQVNRP